MFKKTLISVAVASSLGLTGCFDSGSSGKNANPNYKINNPAIDGKTWPIFNPITSQLPIPNDLIFDSEQGDGTFGVGDTSPPVTTALNELSGASTVAPAVIQFNGRIDADTVNYGQTVFLLELEYASGDPVQGLSNQEPPTVTGLANARADVETLSGTSAIRILPLEPLNPRKRYIAVVTKGVTDLNGDAIIASPSYGSLTDEAQPLGNSALAPVRALINNLWEPSAAGFFQAASIPLTADDIAISYSFTTSNDQKVLQYIAEPAAWFEDQLETFVKVSAAKQAVAGGAKSFSAVQPIVDGTYAAFPNIPINEEGETAAEALPSLFGGGAPCEGDTGAAAFDCAGISLASNFSGLLPTPTPVNRSDADFTINGSSVNFVALKSAVAGKVLGNLGFDTTSVAIAEGTVALPYYLGTSSSGVVTESWEADSALAQALNSAFEAVDLAIPQADASVSTAVNYVFPFPKKKADVDVPFVALYPNSNDPIKGAVLYQHGITTDRSSALTFGTALAANGYVVIAIDQPLHGVAGFTDEEQQELADLLLDGAGLPVNDTNRAALLNRQLSLGLLATIRSEDLCGATLSPDDATAIQQVLGGQCGATRAEEMGGLISIENTAANAGSTIPGLAPNIGSERHFGLYAEQPGVPAAIDFENGVGDSGSLYINLSSFLTTRDNGRQSAVDQMNLRASIPGLELPLISTPTNGIAPGSTTDVQADDTFFFAGHSLGTITGTPFVASVNADQLGVTITDGTGPGTVSSDFNDISAASLLTPGGGIVRLLENSPSFAPRILFGLQQAAGLEQGDANLETYFNVFQATVDTADPVNFVASLEASGTVVLLSEVSGDTVIPNAADEEVWGIPRLTGTFTPAQTELPVNVTVDSFNAPLAGTKPLTLGDALITTYSEGNHGTPTSADVPAVFGQMVCETYVLYGEDPGSLPGFCAP